MNAQILLRTAALVLALIGASLSAVNAATKAELDALHKALRTDEMLRIMGEEGAIEATKLQDDMFPSRALSSWQQAVKVIYAHDDMAAAFRAGFDRELADTDVTALVDFYQSALGTRVAEIEVEARRAIASEEVEVAAKVAFGTLAPSRAVLVDRFIAQGDLVERNVAGAMTANLAFFQGLVEGGGFEMEESEILAQVWEQEDEIRADTSDWVGGYLTLAYGPLSDAELTGYIDLLDTRAGRDLNRALFAGFYDVFTRISFDLGKAASGFMMSEEL